MTSSPNPEPVRRAIARIRHVNGNVVGAGFLISESCLLTCAHVVTEALGLPQTTSQAPAGLIDLDLIAHDYTFCSLQARIVFWSPICPGKRGEDIAGLQLIGEISKAFQPVKLEKVDDWWKHSFGTFGFPKGYDLGTWAHGELLGARGGDGWVQMEGIRVQGHPIQPGFSGSPIWDELLDSVIGMAVAADRKRDTQTAYMIPAEILSAALEALSLIEILSPLYNKIERPIRTAFNACCPKGWSHPMPAALEAIVAELQDIPQGDASHSCILQFVVRLAAAVPEPLSQQLEHWVTEQGYGWPMLREQIQPVRPINQMSYLVIKVEDTRPKSDQYFVKAWFVADQISGVRWDDCCRALMVPDLPPGKEGFTMEEILGLLDGLLDQVDEFCDLTIEFFLPLDQLNYAVDTWEVQGLGIPQIIGHEYRVLVRSVERLSPTYNRYRGVWRQNWQTLQQIEQPRLLDAFIVGDGCDPRTLLNQLKPRNVLGLQLTQIPEHLKLKAAFTALLQAGLPLGLWARQSLPQCNSRIELDRILECCVMELPDQVRQKRLDSCTCDPDAHIGCHLSLLWEDPDRLPEVLQYQMP